ncbi:hypothetical protein KEM54_004176, partial [Ascosphaera aggregata]
LSDLGLMDQLSVFCLRIMDSYRSSVVSILNDDDNPSFTVLRASIGHSPASSLSSSAQQYPSSQLQDSQQLPHHTSNTRRGGPGSPIFSPMSFSDSSLFRTPTQHFHDYQSNEHQFPIQQTRLPEVSNVKATVKRAKVQRASQSTLPSPAPSLNEQADVKASKVSKRNKYPCPFAQSHGCSATFTTSGHAARHGKKHTGEKGVSCPTCGKAFTRKDNMKQHIRTHRGGEAKKEASTKKAEAEQRRNRYSIVPSELGSLSPSDGEQQQCLPYCSVAPPPIMTMPHNQFPGIYSHGVPPSCATTAHPYCYAEPVEAPYTAMGTTLSGPGILPQPGRHSAGRLDALASVAATTLYDANCYR